MYASNSSNNSLENVNSGGPQHVYVVCNAVPARLVVFSISIAVLCFYITVALKVLVEQIPELLLVCKHIRQDEVQ